MAIRLITGTPGHGKTLLAVGEIFETLLPRVIQEGRKIRTNIDGLVLVTPEENANIELVTDDDIKNWSAGPDNIFYVVDEAQYIWPARQAGSKVPEQTDKIPTHRHRGIDFLLITQHPTLIDYGIKHMVDNHRHVHRPRGLKYSKVREWDGLNPDPAPVQTEGMAEKERLVFKKKWFTRYKSATAHYVKARVPWKMIGTAALVLLVIAGGVYKVAVTLGGIKDTAMANGAQIAAARLCEPVGLVGGVRAFRTPAGVLVGEDVCN